MKECEEGKAWNWLKKNLQTPKMSEEHKRQTAFKIPPFCIQMPAQLHRYMKKRGPPSQFELSNQVEVLESQVKQLKSNIPIKFLMLSDCLHLHAENNFISHFL